MQQAEVVRTVGREDVPVAGLDECVDEAALDGAGADAAEAREQAVRQRVVRLVKDRGDFGPAALLQRDVDQICGAGTLAFLPRQGRAGGAPEQMHSKLAQRAQGSAFSGAAPALGSIFELVVEDPRSSWVRS